MEELREDVLGKRRVYPQACSKVLSKTMDVEVKLLLNQKVILPPSEKWDSFKHPIKTKEELHAEREEISETLAHLKALDKEVGNTIGNVLKKVEDVSKVLKVVVKEKDSEVLKNVCRV